MWESRSGGYLLNCWPARDGEGLALSYPPCDGPCDGSLIGSLVGSLIGSLIGTLSIWRRRLAPKYPSMYSILLSTTFCRRRKPKRAARFRCRCTLPRGLLGYPDRSP